jgi:hypothetical protein
MKADGHGAPVAVIRQELFERTSKADRARERT